MLYGQLRISIACAAFRILSFEMHMVSYYRPIVTLCLKCTVFEIMATYWSKIGLQNLSHSHLAHSLGVTPCEFFDDSYQARKSNHGAIRWCTNAFDTGCDRQTDRHVAVAVRRAGKKLYTVRQTSAVFWKRECIYVDDV